MMRLLEIFEKTPKIKTKRVKKSTCSDEKAKITANDDPCNGLSSALQLIPQSGRRFTGDQGLAAGGCTEAEDATFPLLRYPSPSSHKLEIDRGEGSGINTLTISRIPAFIFLASISTSVAAPPAEGPPPASSPVPLCLQ